MSTEATPEPLPEIQFQPMSYTVGHWKMFVPQGAYELSAPYQRGSVWTLEQRRALVKSLYMHLPIGSVIISKIRYRQDGVSFRVIDGRQRIEAIVAFTQDEFTVPAWWFRPGDLRAEAAGNAEVTWSDLSDAAATRLEVAAHFPALEFNGQVDIWFDAEGKRQSRERSDDEVLAMEAQIFDLINFGGTAQTEENRERARQVAAHPEQHQS